MVFSNSISEYFDPPNWPQEGNQQQSGIIPATDHPLQILASPPAQVSGSIRPGSMLDRARLARVPLPEPGLKCPRCDSSNTKFCYFNNYNLSQPRHFCKTCRRYWTRGGALRNVPVGGGYRRNKRSKGRTKSASAQPHPAQRNRNGGGSSSNINTALPGASVNTNTNANANGGFSSQMLLPPPPPYIPGLHHLNEYMGGGFGLNNLGGGGAGEFEMGGTSSSGVSRVHQLSNLLNGSTGGLYPTLTFHQESNSTSTANELNQDHASGYGSQVSRVKPEEDSQGLNMSKNFMMGIDQANGDHDNDDWGSGNAWTEISGFQAPSSAGNLL